MLRIKFGQSLLIKFALLLCFYITGCSYDFSSDHYINLEEPSTNNVIFLDEFNNLDTINSNTEFRYTLNNNPHKTLVRNTVYNDNKLIHSTHKDNIGSFKIYPSNYTDGIHQIRIESVYTPGIENVATQAGRGNVTEIIELKYVIHRNPSTPPSINEVLIKNGSVFVSWDKINEAEFENAYLSVNCKGVESRYPLTQEIIVKGNYVDTATFLYGKNSNYRLDEENLDADYSIIFASKYVDLYSNSKRLSFQRDWFSLDVSYVDLNSYKVKWPKHPLYANIDSIEINFDSHKFYGSSQGGEHLISSPYVFGKEYEAEIRPLKKGIYYSIYSLYDIGLDDQTFGLFDLDKYFVKSFFYNPNNQQYYALIVDDVIYGNFIYYFYQYSSNFKLIKKTKLEISNINPRGCRIYQDKNEIYLDSNYGTYVLNADNLKTLHVHTFHSEKKRTILRGDIQKTWIESKQEITITNAKTKELISTKKAYGASYLSKDGKYLSVQNRSSNTVYRINNNGLEKVMDFSNYTGEQLIKDDMLFYCTNDSVIIINLLNGNSKSFKFGASQQKLRYNSDSKKLIVDQLGSHAIYDLKTNHISLLSSNDSKNNFGKFYNYDRKYNLWIINKKLIHSKGIYVDL